MENRNERNGLDFPIDWTHWIYPQTWTREEREAFYLLFEGYRCHKTSITIPATSIEMAMRMHEHVCYSNPRLFYIKAVEWRYHPLMRTATAYPAYRFDAATCSEMLRQMEARTAPFICRIVGLPEAERLREIHDYLIQTCTYKDKEAPYSHEAVGALLYGIAVCEGMAKAFSYLAGRARLGGVIVTGTATGGGDLCLHAAGHAWNIFNIDGQPYHIDVTFDQSVSSDRLIRYDYFLLSDDQIAVDHCYTGMAGGYDYTCYTGRQCTRSYEYYRENGHYIGNLTELQNLARKELRPGQPLVVKTPDWREDTDIVANRLLNAVTAAIPLRYALLPTEVTAAYNKARGIYQFDLG